jgi:hypothetical protein
VQNERVYRITKEPLHIRTIGLLLRLLFLLSIVVFDSVVSKSCWVFVLVCTIACLKWSSKSVSSLNSLALLSHRQLHTFKLQQPPQLGVLLRSPSRLPRNPIRHFLLHILQLSVTMTSATQRQNYSHRHMKTTTNTTMPV